MDAFGALYVIVEVSHLGKHYVFLAVEILHDLPTLIVYMYDD